MKLGPGSANDLDLAVQLHHVLAAVQSTKVADEHEYGRPVTPQRAERHGFTVLVENGLRGEVVGAFQHY